MKMNTFVIFDKELNVYDTIYTYCELAKKNLFYWEKTTGKELYMATKNWFDSAINTEE